MRLFIITAFVICSYMANAQVKNTPPATPATPNTKVTVNTNTNTNTSVTINGKTYVSSSSASSPGKSTSKSKTKVSSNSSSTSISVQDSDYTYSIRASFDDHKTEKIRRLLMYSLDKEHLSTKGDSYVWKKVENGETAYNFLLSEGSLKATVNKELNSNSAVDKFVTLGEKISEVLSD